MSQLQTRILLKHDLEKNWLKATNFKPKAGEIIIYDAETTEEDYVGTSRDYMATSPRLKVGDGITYINKLPFANAFKNDILTTTTFGKYTGSTHDVKTIPAKGKTAEEVLFDALEAGSVSIEQEPYIINQQSSYFVEMGTVDPISYDIRCVEGRYSTGQSSDVDFTVSISATDEDNTYYGSEPTLDGTESGTLGNTEAITKNITVTIWGYYREDNATGLTDYYGNDLPEELKIQGGDLIPQSYNINAVAGCFYGFPNDTLPTNNRDDISDYFRNLKNRNDKDGSSIDDVVNWGAWTSNTRLTTIDTLGFWKNFYIAVPADDIYPPNLSIMDSNNNTVTCSYLGKVYIADARNDSRYKNEFHVFASLNNIGYNRVTLKLSWS